MLVFFFSITRLINGGIFHEIELQEMRAYMKQAMDIAVIGKNKGLVSSHIECCHSSEK